jgi:hypothetical protein
MMAGKELQLAHRAIFASGYTTLAAAGDAALADDFRSAAAFCGDILDQLARHYRPVLMPFFLIPTCGVLCNS